MQSVSSIRYRGLRAARAKSGHWSSKGDLRFFGIRGLPVNAAVWLHFGKKYRPIVGEGRSAARIRPKVHEDRRLARMRSCDNIPGHENAVKEPNYQACGQAIFGGNTNAGHRGTGNDANFSNWPHPSCQLSWLPFPLCMILAEYCCMECEMRVCCYFGPGSPPTLPPSVPEPVRSVPGPTMPGEPVKLGSSPIWE